MHNPDHDQESDALKNVAKERRWSARQSMCAAAVLKNQEGCEYEIEIINMTEDGLMVNLNEEMMIPLFSLLSLEMVGFFSCQCYPVWQNNRSVGLQLTLPIHPAIIAAMARSYPVL